jgi:hypothetical protein
MVEYCDWLLQEASLWINQMTTTQWFMALVVVAVVGFMCMRGFGSRSNY